MLFEFYFCLICNYGLAQEDNSTTIPRHKVVTPPVHQWIAYQAAIGNVWQDIPQEIKDHLDDYSSVWINDSDNNLDHSGYYEMGGINGNPEGILIGSGEEDKDTSGVLCSSGDVPGDYGRSIIDPDDNGPWIYHYWNPDTLQSGNFDDGLSLTAGESKIVCNDYRAKNFKSAYNRAQSLWDNYVIPNYDIDKNKSYYYLGRVVHLLTDMTVPAHVHEDPHADVAEVDDDCYEDFMNDPGGLPWCSGQVYRCFYGSNYEGQCYNYETVLFYSSPVSNSTDLFKLFWYTAQKTQYYASDDSSGNDYYYKDDGTQPIFNPSLWSGEDVEIILNKTDVENYSDCKEDNLVKITEALIPHAIRAVAGLYRLFWHETHAKFEISTYPVNGDIYLDGNKIGNGSVSIFVEVGSHTISFGYVSGYTTPQSQLIDAVAGKTYSRVGSYVGAVTQPPNKPISPNPSNGAINQSINVDISWSDGGGTTSYKVYFGTDSSPDSGEYKGSQTGLSYDPGTLNYNTTYYWRIDAVNSDGTTTGDVWRFTTQTQSSQYSVITSSSPTEGGITSGYGTYVSGSTVTVTANPYLGYTFVNWTEDGSVVFSSRSYSFTINRNRNLIAHFSPDSTPPNTWINDGPTGLIDYNNVTFSYSGQDNTTVSSQLVYSYMLEGYDANWSDFSSSKNKSYNSLPNGSYTFKVRAKDFFNNIDPSPAERSFYILKSNSKILLSVPDGYYALHPVQSPDGTKILYGLYSSHNFDLWVMNSNGSSSPDKLVEGLFPSDWKDDYLMFLQGSWSPDGTKVAFTKGSGKNEDIFDIWVINTDNPDKEYQVTKSGKACMPVWSPDGDKIAYIGVENNTFQIFVINGDGTGLPLKIITPLSFSVWGISWSPDSKKLAYIAYEKIDNNGNFHIYISSSDGTGDPFKLVNNAVIYAHHELLMWLKTSWSPSGKKICYISDVGIDNYLGISIIDSNGNGDRQLIYAGINTVFPTWTSDETKILFSKLAADNKSIKIYLLDYKFDSQSFPSLNLFLPILNQTLSGTVNVIGTVNNNTSVDNITCLSALSSWKLEYGKGENPDQWITIASSSDSINNSLIASWRTDYLKAGLYKLRFYATDGIDNNFQSVTVNIEETINKDSLPWLNILLLDNDQDNDGMPDDWEVANGLNPNVNDANLDPDGDGLTNLQEYKLGTNPKNADTDGDGMPDGWEVQNSLNPKVNDCNEDPDQDGWTNCQEYWFGTNPRDKNSHPNKGLPWLSIILFD